MDVGTYSGDRDSVADSITEEDEDEDEESDIVDEASDADVGADNVEIAHG